MHRINTFKNVYAAKDKTAAYKESVIYNQSRVKEDNDSSDGGEGEDDYYGYPTVSFITEHAVT